MFVGSFSKRLVARIDTEHRKNISSHFFRELTGQVFIPGRLIPTPRQITADCGLAWSAPPDSEPAVLEAAKAGSIEFADTYQLII